MWGSGNTCSDMLPGCPAGVSCISRCPWRGPCPARVPYDGNTNPHRLVLTLYVCWAEEKGDFSGKDPTELCGTKPGLEAIE